MRKTNQKKNESIKRVKKYVTYIGEDRFNLMGMVDGYILFIVYTMRGEVMRLISARPATRREKERYYRQAMGKGDNHAKELL